MNIGVLIGLFFPPMRHLKCQKERYTYIELKKNEPVTKIEQVFEAGTEELHDHNVVLSLVAVVLHHGNTHATLHHLWKIQLNGEGSQIQIIGFYILSEMIQRWLIFWII